MNHNSFISGTINSDKAILSVAIKESFIRDIKKRVSPVIAPKSIFNTLKAFVFLLWLNKNGLTYVRKEDLAEMTFSKHEERLTKALNALVAINVLEVRKEFNVKTQRHFYTYHTSYVKTESYDESPLTTYEYNLPEFTVNNLTEKGLFYSLSNATRIVSVCNKPTEISTSSVMEPYIPSDAGFKTMFTSWYNELVIPDYNNVIPGHFSDRDGRFYHRFHEMSKSDRETKVRWDNEKVIEVYDAHSAFFTTCAYYLKYVKTYESEEQKQAFISEADKLLEYTIPNRLYNSIMYYCRKMNYDRGITRDDAKLLCNIYKTRSRKYLFRKSDKKIKDVWWAKRLKGVDEFFAAHFPLIRDFFLDYSRHIEDDKDYPMRCVINPSTHILEWVYKKKSVSDIQHDIMPYEFELFSIGLCKELYEQYGIKTVTVHDAIYMKESDAKKNVDIDALLRKRLGLITLPSVSLF